jgi:hypothetical protein
MLTEQTFTWLHQLSEETYFFYICKYGGMRDFSIDSQFHEPDNEYILIILSLVRKNM